MQSLTHQAWERDYVRLRPAILERYPQIDRSELEAVRGDFARLVELVQRNTDQSADLVRAQLRKVDVEAYGSESDDAETDDRGSRASLDQLRLGDGFAADEREQVINRLSKLNRRLRKFPADGTQLELSVKDRDTTSQKVTLEAWLPKFPHFAATSNEPDLKAALMDVREDLWRQIDDTVNRRKRASRP